MTDLFRPFMAPDVPSAVARVLTPDKDGRVYVGEGALVKQFEQAFSDLVDAPYPPLAMSSCTTALEMALYLVGVRGKQVISTPMTCTATSAAIVRSGARIVWADIDPVTGLIDPNDVAWKKITKDTAAIVAVDWGGRACDYDALRQINFNQRGTIPVIEDAAHALLTHYRGESIARSGGDFTAWSFGPIKHLTCGGHGGALLTPSAPAQERGRLLRWYGLDRNSKADFRCEQDVTEPGWKAHLTDVDAAIGLANLPHARRIVERHRDNACFYAERFQNLDGVTVPPFDPGSSYWTFDLLVDDRESFQRFMSERGIMTSRVHRRNDEHPGYHFPSGPLPGVDAFDSRHICIPVGWWVTDDEREQIADAVISWARSRTAVPA